MNNKELPARVNAKTAMDMLAVRSGHVFSKIVDANPQICHRIAGEVRPKYLTVELQKLLRPVPGVRTLGEDQRTP